MFKLEDLYKPGDKGIVWPVWDGTKLLKTGGTQAGIGDGVETILNPVGANDTTQSTDNEQPVLKISGGYQYIDTDGTNDNYNITLSTTKQELTASASIELNSTITNQHFLSENTNNLNMSMSTSAGFIGFFSGGWKDIIDNTLSHTIVTWVFSGSNGYVYIDGVLAGTGPYTQMPLDGLVKMFSNNDGTAGFLNGKFYGGFFIDRPLGSGERRNAEEFLSKKSGLVYSTRRTKMVTSAIIA